MNKKYFAVLAAVLSLSLASCGDSDSSSTAETTTTTTAVTTTSAPAEESSVPDESGEESSPDDSSEDESDTETTTTTAAAESEPETTTSATTTTTTTTTKKTTTTTTTTTAKKTSTTTTAKPQPTVKILASGNCGDKGDNVKWTFDENGTVTITGKGKVKDFMIADAVRKAGIDVGSHNEIIKKAVVGNGVETLSGAFMGCTECKEITLPDTLTEISTYAFEYCGVENLVIPKSVKKIDTWAFACCGVKKLTIPGTMKTIGSQAFAWCTELEELNLSEGIETIEEVAFTACPSLKSVTIPASVKTIGERAFAFVQAAAIEPTEDGYDHNFIIKGKAGSAAEKYAKDNNLKFVAI